MVLKMLASSDLDGNEHSVSPIIACNYDVGESNPCGSRNETIKRNEVPLIPNADKRTLEKFIEGDEILDQKNPFKSDDTVFDELGPAAPNNECTTSYIRSDRNGHDEELDFITKEEILRQSKYVQTYIKNPDKQLNYDKSVIEQMDAIRATGHQARPPIPAPRKINCHITDESKTCPYNEKIRSLPRGKIAKTLQQTTVKPIPMMRRDYCDLKVRVGSADAGESLYDSNEVVQNALKFDSRFRTVEFGSQDDIDTIAEKTDIGSTVPDTSLQSDIFSDSIPSTPSTSSELIQTAPSNPNESDYHIKRKDSNFAEEIKKSFSNTIKSADFRKYLQSRGLTLIPTRSTSISSTPTATKQRQPTKLSVLSKFLQSNIFEPKTGHSVKLQGSSTSLLNPKKPKNSSVNEGGNKSSHIGRSYSMSAKPKVSCRQLEYRNTHYAKEDDNGQFATMDFNRTTRLRTSFAGRSSQPSFDSSYRRSMRNAGIQVNLETSKNAPGGLQAHLLENSSSHEIPIRQKVSTQKIPLQRYLPVEKYSKMEHKSPEQDNGLKGSTASSHTVVPVYSEPLRYGDPINYHIYEQTPDNLRCEMLYGHIGYIGTSQLSGWHPQNRRSFSSVQETPTYGRLRSTYVSSPISTQSTPVRCTSETLDRQQILHKIYDFYRRSIRSNKLQNLKANDTEPALYNGAGVPSGHKIGRSEEQARFPNMEDGHVTEVVQVRGPPSMTLKEQVNAPQQTQYDRNIENIYSFVTKKMNQLRVHEANEQRVGSIANIRNSTRLPRRVMLLNSSYGGNCTPQPLHHAIGGEVDYVNIRGPPDGIQYRTSHCYVLSNDK
ncbi:uncharacterized protein LOC126577931 [Anopheles aquasalis]|uniref:uncharacterized protein LOC126577931 n=1 Tax=Anopheles aquasalis TaxID=42839 RepID=UPI00215AC8DF|nr:uncharacterized protein LOC126577931 [Anopheles aquasalis]XP_050095969.1 uncharacterized protein LOC126577931 [Anopheles aquasalis]